MLKSDIAPRKDPGKETWKCKSQSVRAWDNARNILYIERKRSEQEKKRSPTPQLMKNC